MIANIAEILDEPSRSAPDRAALIFDDGDGATVCSYGDLRAATERWAGTLAARGAAFGDGGTILEEAVDQTTTPERAPGGEAAALVLFTSGTTGVPKPVAISHHAIAARVSAYRAPFHLDRPPNVTIMCVPSLHVGSMLGLLLTLYAGDTTVVQPRSDAGRWLTAMQRHRVASAFLVPTMLARILDHRDLAATATSSLRSISYGAAAAPRELIQRAMTQWPEAGFANVFGQTETLGTYAALSPTDHRDPRLIGSVGRAGRPPRQARNCARGAVAGSPRSSCGR